MTKSDTTTDAWKTGNVVSISFSAFFADLGYQAVLAGFPLLLVITLKQPFWEYGLATAISYGGGALFSYYGAKLGEKIGHKKLAIIGNSGIPLLSLCGLLANPAWAIGFLVGGWWARNLRSPSRRVMLTQAVPDKTARTKAFGFLHGLDVGGGALAGLYVVIAIACHVALKWVFVATILPLAVSTYCLTRVDLNGDTKYLAPQKKPENKSDLFGGAAIPDPNDEDGLSKEKLLKSLSSKLIYSSLLYGFTFYSTGFLVLTTAKSTDSKIGGIAAYLVVQLVSALTGYLLAPRLAKNLLRQFISLGSFGYLAGGMGAVTVALSSIYHLDLIGFYLGVTIIGFALGIIDTLEPAAMSLVSQKDRIAKGFGSLAAARSLGTFSANLIMGLLYGVGVGYAYGYAAILAASAGVVVLLAIPATVRYEKLNS